MQRVRYVDVADELDEVFKSHWEEVPMAGTPGLTLDLNHEGYKQVDAVGMYVGLVARHIHTKEIVGYISIAVHRHPHHYNNLFAVADCFYVKKDWRGNGLMTAMVKEVERILVSLYKDVHIQFGVNTLLRCDGLFKRLGFVPADVTYVKRVTL